jgi:hypothetical protein
MDSSLLIPTMGILRRYRPLLLGAGVLFGVSACAGDSPAAAPSAFSKQGLPARTSFALGVPATVPVRSLPLTAPLTFAPISLVLNPDTPAPTRPVLAETGRAPRTRVNGYAGVQLPLRGIANVRDGHITGTPVWVRDARTGRRLAESVTYYDGSFVVDVPTGPDGVPVVVSTELVDEVEAGLTTWLAAPVYLSPEMSEQSLVLGAGSTALTEFLQAVARLENGAGGGLKTARVEFSAGPRFAALVSGIDHIERESFARLAEASPELKDADSVKSLQAGIEQFVSRIAIRRD